MPPNPQNLRPQPPWPKGVSGNPNGRPPKGRAFADLIQLIEDTPGAERAISKVWLQQILKGNLGYFKEFIERSDGKVPTPVDVTATDATGNDFITVTPTEDQPSDGATDKVLE